ncbi:hypothetical protein SAMN04488025_1523 [Planifilum fulgidum]|uniref:Uncharacterized protein n=2 Tax=Planifilum fulgidum TaxID=201973 RepID=A0A1I2SZS2_9BACL|nr:hypothetical protein SAMN04488025_1523 [Planifilum fulgidum]
MKMKKRIRPDLKPRKPFPVVPEAVKKAAAMYKKEGESENVGPSRAWVSGKLYYYSTYVRGKFNPTKTSQGYLVIREDGTVPPFSEAKKPLRMINSTDGMFREILLAGPRYANRSTYNWEELERLLNRIQDILNEPLPPDIQTAFDVFRSIPRKALEKQQELREIVLDTEKMLHELSTHYVITEEFVQRLRSRFYRYIECLFIQHDVQVSTYEEREKFLGYLSSRVSITRFPFWWCYRRLKKHHQAMTITNKADLEAHEDVRNDIRREKNTEKHFEWVFSITRNPRDEEKSEGK